MGGSHEGDVMEPARPGMPLEVVQAQAVLGLAVVELALLLLAGGLLAEVGPPSTSCSPTEASQAQWNTPTCWSNTGSSAVTAPTTSWFATSPTSST